MSGLHRGVRGEQAALAHQLHVVDIAVRPHRFAAVLEASQEFEAEQGRMALVHVVGVNAKAEGVQQPRPTDAQDDLLL